MNLQTIALVLLGLWALLLVKRFLLWRYLSRRLPDKFMTPENVGAVLFTPWPDQEYIEVQNQGAGGGGSTGFTPSGVSFTLPEVARRNFPLLQRKTRRGRKK